MATVGVIDVKDLTVFIGGTAISCATDATLEASRDMREILCKDTSAGVDYKYSNFRWTISGSGLYAMDAANGGGALMTTLIAGTSYPTLRFSTAVSGDVKYEGTAALSSVSLSSSGASGENAGYSFTFQGIGIITAGVNT